MEFACDEQGDLHRAGWTALLVFVLTPGMSYQVADDTEPHRSSTRVGAKLFIVD
jgi:hypothetical protein